MKRLRCATFVAALVALGVSCTLSKSGTLTNASPTSSTSTGSGGPCAQGAQGACYSGAAGTEGKGACKGGMQVCQPDGFFGPCVGEVDPTAEDCSTPIDDNCNGVVNEASAGCTCEAGATMPCYDGPAKTMDVGTCKSGTKTCVAGTQESDCMNEVLPSTLEDCAAKIDTNCDGTTPACTGNPTWSATWGKVASNQVLGLAPSASGDVWVTGIYQGMIDVGVNTMLTSMGGSEDIFLFKYDSTGDLLFSASFGDGAMQEAHHAAATPDGGVVIVGYCGGTTNFGGTSLMTKGVWDACVAMFDIKGGHVWSKIFGDVSDQFAESVAVDSTGNVFITGEFNGNIQFDETASNHLSAGGTDMFIVELDKTGAWKWDATYGDGADQYAYDITVDPAGNPTVVGKFNGKLGPLTATNNMSFDSYVVAFDPSGNIRWSQSFGDDNNQMFTGVAADAAGDLTIVGNDNGTTAYGGLKLTGNGGSDVIVAKYKSGGDYQFAKRYGDAGEQTANGVAIDPFGNILVTGTFGGTMNFGTTPPTALTAMGAADLFVGKLTPAGADVWLHQFGDPGGVQVGERIASDPIARVFVGGAFTSIDFGMINVLGPGAFVAEVAP